MWYGGVSRTYGHHFEDQDADGSINFILNIKICGL
jgi:hypothetical protein